MVWSLEPLPRFIVYVSGFHFSITGLHAQYASAPLVILLSSILENHLDETRSKSVISQRVSVFSIPPYSMEPLIASHNGLGELRKATNHAWLLLTEFSCMQSTMLKRLDSLLHCGNDNFFELIPFIWQSLRHEHLCFAFFGLVNINCMFRYHHGPLYMIL